jgi:hypothetical protein
MAQTLDDAWAKVEWAHRQLERINGLVRPFLESNPYLVRDEINAERTQRVIAAHSPLPPPAEVTFVFGDLVHSLHSALDYLVCSLVESVGQPITKKHAFPMFGERTAYEAKAPQMLRHVPYEAIEFIESVQPYHYTEWAIKHGKSADEIAAEVEFMPLMRLYRLSIEEKHHALLLTTSLMDIHGTYVSHDRTEQEPSGVSFRLSRAHDKVEIVIELDPAKPDEQFGKSFAAKVALAQEGPLGMGVEDLSRMLYNEVAHRILTPIWQRRLLPLTRPRYLPYA